MRDTEALRSLEPLQRQLCVLSREYEHMRLPGSPGGISGRRADGAAGTNEPVFAAVQRLEFVENCLHDTEKRFTEAMERVNRILGRAVKDPVLTTILIEYYVLGHTDEATGERIHMSARGVNRIRNAFMKRLEREDVA